ncbi:ABC transporter ATP-binding protein [Natronobacterium gregoryi]|uniref:ABC transporter ATP-binding protein n=3 Tax=Natronobacterium gregoryi TaxID=44930 RepID=L0ALT4_NATGS|nr:ABC transporter ATP-binding protein [Natronobacterium gregoryi]AFZ74117.1 ABC-type multidrug transport system, ATPase component [Natronobacterium gregoryi SP2]PLK22086.1 ABC transporter ATP-binding protein [Natronobacterium gregoryi SP2]SFI49755.1 ABC-type multidrug transport system, ATPase component [Natronobacterium gregoryi]
MVLQLESIGKQYGDNAWGVRDVTIELDPGIHGLLGPNGSGKSTLMRIITTVMDPSTGTAYWNGTDITESPSAVRDVLGYLPQDFGVYPNLTAREFLEYMASLRGLNKETANARIDELLTLMNLQTDQDRRLHTFSGGMRQSVGIAQALLNDPDLLVVDEPTVGLDPEKRTQVRNLLSSAASDRVVLLSTHIVPDVEATANKVALLHDGDLLTHTDPESLVKATEGKVYEYVATRDEMDQLRQQYQVTGTVQRSDGIKVRVVADERPSPEAETVTPTLEDAYLEHIGQRESN